MRPVTRSVICDAGCHSVNRRTGDIRSIHIERAAVWLTGVIPPRVLQRALGSVHRESGLLARLLLVSPPHRPRVWSEKTVAAETKAVWSGLLDRLYELTHETTADGTDLPRIIDLGPEAKLRYSAFYDAHNLETKDLDTDLSAAWSKLEEIPGRLALIDHKVRLVSGEAGLDPHTIDGESVYRAKRLLTKHFGADEPVEKIHAGRARDYREWLAKEYATATVAR